jgi:hypothetical protein
LIERFPHSDALSSQAKRETSQKLARSHKLSSVTIIQREILRRLRDSG